MGCVYLKRIGKTICKYTEAKLFIKKKCRIFSGKIFLEMIVFHLHTIMV